MGSAMKAEVRNKGKVKCPEAALSLPRFPHHCSVNLSCINVVEAVEAAQRGIHPGEVVQLLTWGSAQGEC